MPKNKRKTAKKKTAKRKVAKKPVKIGPPTKYTEKMDVQVKILAEKGFIDDEIAEVFGVTKQTVNNWKKKYPQFFESMKAGKDIADQNVVRSLYRRACGYSHPDVHISNHKGVITLTPIIKHYAPETVACIYWTKNRLGWSDKQELEHSGLMTLADIAALVMSNRSKKKK